MQAWALSQIAMANPQLFDMHEVNVRLLRTIRIASPDTLLIQPEQMAAAGGAAGPSPEQLKLDALNIKGQQDQQRHQNKMTEMAAAQQGDAAERAQDGQTAALESADRAADRQQDERATTLKAEVEQMKLRAQEKALTHKLFGGPSF